MLRFVSVRIEMGVHALCREAMAPRALLPGASWSHGCSGMLSWLSQSRVRSVGRFEKVALRSCRCAAAETLDYASSAEKRQVSPQECTYGAVNVLWVASELQRLLTMQVSFTKRMPAWTRFGIVWSDRPG